jgi:hypothetical protein
MERDAAALSKGDVILVDGKPETVKRVWFYDGIVVDLESGKALHPQFGDTFTKPPLGENGGL